MAAYKLQLKKLKPFFPVYSLSLVHLIVIFKQERLGRNFYFFCFCFENNGFPFGLLAFHKPRGSSVVSRFTALLDCQEHTAHAFLQTTPDREE